MVEQMSKIQASEWDFKGFIPGSSDIDAALLASAQFFSLPPIAFESEMAKDMHIFQAAFYRGIAWANYKNQLEKQSGGSLISE